MEHQTGPEVVIVSDMAEAIAAIETMDDLRALDEREWPYTFAGVQLPRDVRLDVWLMDTFHQRPIALLCAGLGLGFCLGVGLGFALRRLA